MKDNPLELAKDVLEKYDMVNRPIENGEIHTDIGPSYVLYAANAAPQLARAWLDAQVEIEQYKSVVEKSREGFMREHERADNAEDTIARQSVDLRSKTEWRAALEMAKNTLEKVESVEWHNYYDSEKPKVECPWCGVQSWKGHAPDCPRQTTLAAINEVLMDDKPD